VSDMQTSSVTGKMRSKVIQGGPNLQCKFDDADNYTVQFKVSGRVLPIAGNINPVATVTWFLGGNNLSRKLSVYDGASITGCATNVTVTVADETDITDTSAQQDYVVTIMTAKGSRPATQQPPTYSIYQAANAGPATKRLGNSFVLGGTSIVVPVPSNAGVISVFGTASAPNGHTYVEGDLIIRQRNVTGLVVKQYDARNMGWVPISPQTVDIELINNSTIDTLMGLVWGIDG
jgi:hypothetical protein